jgi:hypothetical protein
MARGQNFRGKKPAGSGRKRGSRNKLTQGIKEVIEASFFGLCDGNPGDYLAAVAKSDPGVYLTFVGRVIPKQLEADINVHDFRARLVAARQRVKLRANGENQPEAARPEQVC